MNWEEAHRQLKVILDYADSVADSEAEIDAGTLDVAEALKVLYEQSGWADDPDWLEFKPPRPDALGKVNTSSRNRFAGWINWQADLRNKSPLAKQHTYRLLTASDICSRLTLGETGGVCTERVVRPLGWMLKHGHEDHLVIVWQAAADLADPDPPTSVHVRQALSQWKKDNKVSVKRSVVRNRAETKRIKATEAVRQLHEAGDPTQWNIFLEWMTDEARRVLEENQ